MIKFRDRCIQVHGVMIMATEEEDFHAVLLERIMRDNGWTEDQTEQMIEAGQIKFGFRRDWGDGPKFDAYSEGMYKSPTQIKQVCGLDEYYMKNAVAPIEELGYTRLGEPQPIKFYDPVDDCPF